MERKRFFTNKVTIFSIISAVIVFIIALLSIQKLNPIFKGWIIALSAIIFILTLAWGILIAWYLLKEKMRKVIITVIIVCSLVGYAISLPGLLLASKLEGYPLETFTSPSGKNKVVVLHTGFTDAVYKAYPVKLKMFYQQQDNGFVSHHDDWGGADLEVEWVTDNKAIVKVISGSGIKNENSNEDDIIIVEFD